MNNVVSHVVLTARNEALYAFNVPRAVSLFDRLGATNTDVGASIWFGENHGGTPTLFDHEFTPALLIFVAQCVQDCREAGTRHE